VKDALEVLQEAAGPSNAMLFLKLGVAGWEPVGEEMLFATLEGKSGEAAIVVCDADGNAKAMSAWLNERSEQEALDALSTKGLKKFEGPVKLPI
jgi:hypothetical protein